MLCPRMARKRGERGETLVEILVAVAILGVAGIAILGGMQMAVTASDLHRKETTGGAYVRSFAEAIQNYVSTPVASGPSNYRPCSTATLDYYKPFVVGSLNIPSGFAVHQLAAKSVGPNGAATGCGTDTGVQQVTLTVASTDAENPSTQSLTIVLRKPCDPGSATC